MNYVVKISEEDRDEIERRYYAEESIANLLDRLGNKTTDVPNVDMIFAKYLEEYTAAFKSYSEFGKYLERKYTPKDLEGKAKEWQIEFETFSMIFKTGEDNASK